MQHPSTPSSRSRAHSPTGTASLSASLSSSCTSMLQAHCASAGSNGSGTLQSSHAASPVASFSQLGQGQGHGAGHQQHQQQQHQQQQGGRCRSYSAAVAAHRPALGSCSPSSPSTAGARFSFGSQLQSQSHMLAFPHAQQASSGFGGQHQQLPPHASPLSSAFVPTPASSPLHAAPSFAHDNLGYGNLQGGLEVGVGIMSVGTAQTGNARHRESVRVGDGCSFSAALCFPALRSRFVRSGT